MHKYVFYNMLKHMRTTIDMSDALFREARAFTDNQNQTFKDLVEMALRFYLQSQKKVKKPFKLKDASFGKGGLQPGIQEGNWEQIRELIYEGRGG